MPSSAKFSPNRRYSARAGPKSPPIAPPRVTTTSVASRGPCHSRVKSPSGQYTSKCRNPGARLGLHDAHHVEQLQWRTDAAITHGRHPKPHVEWSARSHTLSALAASGGHTCAGARAD